MLNDTNYQKAFVDKTISNEEIIFVYRVYFQLLDNQQLLQIVDNQEFFNKVCDYFIEKSNGKIGKRPICQFIYFVYILKCLGNQIFKDVKMFDFSSENVYKLNRIIGNNTNKISPSYYSKLCGTTGLLLFLLKDCIEYSGINILEKKTPIQKIYNNYNYNIDIHNSKLYKLNFYLTKYHNNNN